MIKKKFCNVLKFVLADIIQPIYLKDGTILLERKIENVIGLKIDSNFYYYNPIDKKVLPCKNCKRLNIIQTFNEPPTNTPLELKILYEEEIKKILNAKSDPEWFNARFVRVKQTLKSKAEEDNESFYSHEGFYIMARGELYFKNSSAKIEKISIQENMDIEPYTEKKFPEGQKYMSEFFDQLAKELEKEREEYERLRENYPNL